MARTSEGQPTRGGRRAEFPGGCLPPITMPTPTITDLDATSQTGTEHRHTLRGRVLLIEDEPLLCRTMAMLLRSAGFSVHDTGNGRVALAAFKRQPFDVVITDMYMPDCDGIELILKVRATYPAARIVAISADPGSLEVLRMASHLGADATLAKPFTAGQLLDALSRVLSRP